MEVELIDLDGTLKWSLGRTVVVQEERHQRRLAIRTEDTQHVSKLFVKTFISLKTFIPNFVAFIVHIIRNLISCIHRMSFSVTLAKQELKSAIVSLSTSWEVDNVH